MNTEQLMLLGVIVAMVVVGVFVVHDVMSATIL